jgi:hypothetical protein
MLAPHQLDSATATATATGMHLFFFFLLFCLCNQSPILPFPDLPLSIAYTLFGQLVPIHLLVSTVSKANSFFISNVPILLFFVFFHNQSIRSFPFLALRFYHSVFISSFPSLPKVRSISVDPAQIGLATR